MSKDPPPVEVMCTGVGLRKLRKYLAGRTCYMGVIHQVTYHLELAELERQYATEVHGTFVFGARYSSFGSKSLAFWAQYFKLYPLDYGAYEIKRLQYLRQTKVRISMSYTLMELYVAVTSPRKKGAKS